MGDTHNYSFFGQNTGLFLQSSSKNEPFVFFRCIKKRDERSWEKPSRREGKTIKVGLEEIIMLLQVLEQKMKSWSTVHRFKEEKTRISIKWDENEDKTLWIHVGNYSKKLNFAQVEILKHLLKHIFKEKIEFSTTSTFLKESNAQNITKEINQTKDSSPENSETDGLIVIEESSIEGKTKEMEGIIKNETEKALLIEFAPGNEKWIPKSTIKSQYGIKNGSKQAFLIDEWILKKNELVT